MSETPLSPEVKKRFIEEHRDLGNKVHLSEEEQARMRELRVLLGYDSAKSTPTPEVKKLQRRQIVAGTTLKGKAKPEPELTQEEMRDISESYKCPRKPS